MTARDRLKSLENMEKWQQWLSRISYKPNIKMEIVDQFNDYLNLKISVNTIDSRDGFSPIVIYHSNIIDNRFVRNFDDFKNYVIERILQMERHETNEFLKIDGKLIHDPHEGER